MVGGRLCVSCHNRQWEFRRGRNGKGTPPRVFLPERRVGVIVDVDKPCEARRIDVAAEHAIDVVEIMAQVLRVAVGKVAFTSPTYGASITLDHFTAFMRGRLTAKPKPPRRLLGAARGRRAA